jgi:hypothetical protein
VRPHHSCSASGPICKLSRVERGAWGVVPLLDFGSASRETPLFNDER